MKKILKLLTATIMICICIAGLTACEKISKIGLNSVNGVDVYAYDADWNVSAKLSDTADIYGRKVELKKGVITVTVPATDVDIELDLAPFFSRNAKHLGTNSYFTRSDVKVDAAKKALLKGYTWVETVAGDSATRKFKQLGYENDATKTDLTKTEIQALPDRKGEIRMYVLNHGSQIGKHITYINKDINSDTQKLNPYYDQEITFRFYGHNQKSAEFKIKVVKAV